MRTVARKSSVTFSGRLYTERHTFQVAGERLTKRAKKLVREVAQLYLWSIWEVLQDRGPGWDTSTLYYQKKKAYYLAKHGLEDHGPWIKTGELVSKLGVFETQEGLKRFRAYAGFEDGKHHSGYSVSELVDILDARRPLISPAWERIKDQVEQMSKDTNVTNNLF